MNEKEAVTPVLSLCNSPFPLLQQLVQFIILHYWSFARISSAVIPLASSFFSTSSASPFFASSAAFASAAAFLFSALASSLVAAFNSAFLAFSCVFRSSRFAVNVATSDSIFSFFCGLFCNDCYIINAGLYSTSLILASLGSCHNNFLP